MARREVQWVEWVPPVRSPALDGGLALAAAAVMALAVMALAPIAQENRASSLVAGAPGSTAVEVAASEAAVAGEALAMAADSEELVSDAAVAEGGAERAHGVRLVRSGAQPWVDVALEARLAYLAAWAVDEAGGNVALAVRHIPTGATATINGDVPMPPASLFKLGVLGQVLAAHEAGALSLDERLRLLPEDWSDGAGVLQRRIGEALPLAELARLMVTWSDNVAANALVRRVGLEGVNRFYAEHGMRASRIFRDARPDVTTAAETAELLTQLTTGALTDEADATLMLELLSQWQAAAWIKEGLPPGTAVAHKSGQLVGVRNDAAVVFGPEGPFVLVVLADRVRNERAAERMISAIAADVRQHLEATYPAGLFALD